MLFNFVKPLYPFALHAVKPETEWAHKKMLQGLGYLEENRHSSWGQFLIKELENSFSSRESRLEQKIWGLTFSNPLGLSAGFDKDAQAAGLWSSFGFGFAEVGAVTQHAQEGNPTPRLFRLSEDRAILNRLGANNSGALAMSTRLKESWQRQARSAPIGINLCKSKITPLEAAAKDYLYSFEVLRNWADYFVINVSSPNTPGLRTLQGGEQLEPILETLQSANSNQQPILIKISPDLEFSDLVIILQLAQTYNISGIVATNTTIARTNLKTTILQDTGNLIEQEAGGISGKPVNQRSTEVIRFIYQFTKGNLPIIGVGGIFSAEDAWAKILAGASLLQVYTGWIYQGPWLVPQILQGLTKHLENSGYGHIYQAVGKETITN
jgi:dihydroorotate dehydrogenase